jgi:tetrahydromethanopterin S-methyltransferase subunit G
MDSLAESTARLVDIEARQDELLRQLDELERRIEQVLAEYAPLAAKTGPQTVLPARPANSPAIKAA